MKIYAIFVSYKCGEHFNSIYTGEEEMLSATEDIIRSIYEDELRGRRLDKKVGKHLAEVKTYFPKELGCNAWFELDDGTWFTITALTESCTKSIVEACKQKDESGFETSKFEIIDDNNPDKKMGIKVVNARDGLYIQPDNYFGDLQNAPLKIDYFDGKLSVMLWYPRDIYTQTDPSVRVVLKGYTTDDEKRFEEEDKNGMFKLLH